MRNVIREGALPTLTSDSEPLASLTHKEKYINDPPLTNPLSYTS